MKLLLFYSPSFWSKPFKKVLETAPEPKSVELKNLVVGFYQCEAGDVDKGGKLITKAVKNIKWIAGKFQTKTVLLHSFSHLSTSKADPSDAKQIITQIISRLESVQYTVQTTPFGYLNEWNLHVGGESLAKVFVDI